MKTTLTTLVLFFSVAIFGRAAEPVPHLAQKPTVAWPHEASDIAPDANVTWGRLDNGVRFMILPTKALPTRASLRLYMNVGSLMEEADQRGMAHYLEHLAFCGTKHFAADDTIEYFQRLGMKFGADTNAYTTFDKTVYKLELPRANEEVVGQGLKLFRDFLDGMLLDPKQVDRERGVILSEIRASDSAEYRAGLAGLQFLAPDNLISQRNVLGSVQTVQSLKHDRFVDFYQKWYTPGRAVVVAAGDFDAAMVQRLIEKQFGDAKAAHGEQPDPNFGKLPSDSNVSAKVFDSPDLQATTVSLNVVGAPFLGPQNVQSLTDDVARTLANLMIDLRLKKISASEVAPIQSGVAEEEQILNLLDTGSISASCNQDKWKAALGLIEQEMRCALVYGFTQSEFNEIKQIPLAALQAQAAQAETIQPSDLVDGLISSLAKNEVFTNPAQNLEHVQKILASMKKEDCEQALRKLWSSGGVKIWLRGPVTLGKNPEEEILGAFQTSAQVQVAAPAEETLGQWQYSNFGPAGAIASRNDQQDLGLVQATFANNVHVNIKSTTIEKNKVRLLIRFGGGLLELPAGKSGLDRLANSAFIDGGLQAHSITDLNRIIAAKDVSVRFAVAEDSFLLGGTCSSNDLDTQLQIATAYLTAPAFRSEAHGQFLSSLESMYGQLDHTAEGAEERFVFPYLRSDDVRFAIPARESLQNLTMDDLKAWMACPLATGYLELTVVGDITPDRALEAIGKTLGALPKRDAVKPTFATERVLHYPSAQSKDFQFASQTPCAISIVSWPTAGKHDIAQDHRTRILVDILRDRLRLKVRTELGATYTPAVARYSSEAFPDFGYVEAELTVDPAKAREIGPLVTAIGAELAAGHITDDEFQRAKSPILASLEEAVKDNGYWLRTLADSQEHPETLDEARHETEDYRAITKADLETLAKQRFGADKATIINLIPTTVQN